MTDAQKDLAIYKAQEIMEKDGVVTVKFVFPNAAEAEAFCNQNQMATSSNRNKAVFMLSLFDVLDSMADAHETLGYYLSYAIYDCHALSLKSM